MIGFNFPRASSIPPEKYKHCIVHPGIRVISKLDEPGVLYCPQCGTTYPEKDTATEETMKPKHTKQTTKIISPKKQKKYYDKQGIEITDEALIADIQRGATVYRYHEEKSGEEKKRHIVRK